MNGNTNGIWKNWLIGIFTTFAISASTGAVVTIKGQGERIAVLESQVHDVRQQLDRIETKIDRLTERRMKEEAP